MKKKTTTKKEDSWEKWRKCGEEKKEKVKKWMKGK